MRRRFQRTAAEYDQAAVVQRIMADELIDRLYVLKLSPAHILDVGCGTGYALAGLAQRFPGAHFVMLDVAVNMLHRIASTPLDGPHLICGDAENMPFAPHSVDMVFCNAVLHWCDYETVFGEFLRVLKPQGLLMFAAFGPDTLKELRAAWRKVDKDAHIHDFVDMHHLGDALARLQFSTPVLDADYVTVTHKEFSGMLGDLKMLGAGNVINRSQRGLCGKHRYHRLKQACEGFRNGQGLFETTCEIIYGHAWAPDRLRSNGADGEVAVPLSRLQRL